MDWLLYLSPVFLVLAGALGMVSVVASLVREMRWGLTKNRSATEIVLTLGFCAFVASIAHVWGDVLALGEPSVSASHLLSALDEWSTSAAWDTVLGVLAIEGSALFLLQWYGDRTKRFFA